MPLLDVSDQSVVPVGPRAVVADRTGPCQLARWVPGLGLRLVVDRGVQGRMWQARALTRLRRGPVAWHGTAEVWLEPWHDATVVHLYVRLDHDGASGAALLAGPGPREVEQLRAALVDRWKAGMRVWRSRVEAGRTPGGPVTSGGGVTV